MSFEPFSVDISVDPNGEPTSIMFHIRADTAEKWRANLTAASDMHPLIARIFSDLGGVKPPMSAQVRAARGEQSREQFRAAAAAVGEQHRQQVAAVTPAAGNDPLPVCPDHGGSKWSTKFTGLYCSSRSGERYCQWKHTCSASCNHPLAAAA